MFDLFRSRDKAVRILLGGLLLLVALSMVTYLIPNYGSTEGTSQDTVVADIGKDPITMRDAQLVVQNAVRGRSVPQEMVSIYVPQIIDQMITERALAYEAVRLGFQASEDDISTAIRVTIPSLFQDGKFVGKEAYAAMLGQQNVTIAEFEADVARSVLVTRLREVAIEGTVVTQAEVEQEYRLRSEKVKIDYAKIVPEKLRAEAKVSDAEVRSYYDKNRTSYNTPEKKSLAILVIDPAKLELSLTPKDDDLRRIYESDKDRFRTPERVRVRHILLNTTGKSAAEEAQIKTKAEDLLKQLKNKGDFAELAKKNSQDPGSAPKGGELNWVVRGQTVKPFEDTAFSLKPNEISNLVKTEYGYHIIQVLEHEQAHLNGFDQVKAQLMEEYRKTGGSRMTQELADRAQSELRKNPQQPEKVASDLKLPTPVRVENVGPGDPLPQIGVNPELEKSIAGLAKGDVSQPVSVAPNKIAMAVITGVTPAHPAPFEEVQKQIRQNLEQAALNSLVSKQSTELFRTAQLSGDLVKAAKAMKLEVKTSPSFDRSGTVEGLGPSNYFWEAFSKPDGSIIGPITLPEGRVVAKVNSHSAVDMADLTKATDSIRTDLKSRKARERNSLFEDGLRQALIKEGKIKIHQDVINRLIANYRG